MTILFEKLGYSILVHYIFSKEKIIQYKTGQPKADVKPLKTRSTKRTYHKQRFALKNREVFSKIN